MKSNYFPIIFFGMKSGDFLSFSIWTDRVLQSICPGTSFPYHAENSLIFLLGCPVFLIPSFLLSHLLSCFIGIDPLLISQEKVHGKYNIWEFVYLKIYFTITLLGWALISMLKVFFLHNFKSITTLSSREECCCWDNSFWFPFFARHTSSFFLS